MDVRLRINNNIVNIAAEGLDLAIRFGTGIWPSTNNEKIFDAPFGVLCDPEMAGRLRAPRDLLNERLLRSYRINEWEDWFREAGEDVAGISGTVYDSSGLMIQTVIHTGGAALVPLNMFTRELAPGQVVRKRAARTVLTGMCYSVGSATRQGSSSLTRFIGQSAITSSTWRR
ncbi:LysR substrate-binding domain-containing protein (plasmid) [Klebsiella pneumoniae]|uniref:LysR substrate-binding domain-containing protein n=1 Tax=Klebsiella pneumoniae TaxID=573 RepID=UPI001FAE061A|nr:LysR substrate-binding domain-containing protein [Klebsiella pneumoniae]